MTMPSQCDFSSLERLHALIGEALALSDAQHLHATGIALDTARLSVEETLADCRRATADGVRSNESIQNGDIPPGRG